MFFSLLFSSHKFILLSRINRSIWNTVFLLPDLFVCMRIPDLKLTNPVDAITTARTPIVPEITPTAVRVRR